LVSVLVSTLNSKFTFLVTSETHKTSSWPATSSSARYKCSNDASDYAGNETNSSAAGKIEAAAIGMRGSHWDWARSRDAVVLLLVFVLWHLDGYTDTAILAILGLYSQLNIGLEERNSWS
jgi:hypothetical protein